jgi:hypothetical protein
MHGCPPTQRLKLIVFLAVDASPYRAIWNLLLTLTNFVAGMDLTVSIWKNFRVSQRRELTRLGLSSNTGGGGEDWVHLTLSNAVN